MVNSNLLPIGTVVILSLAGMLAGEARVGIVAGAVVASVAILSSRFQVRVATGHRREPGGWLMPPSKDGSN